ncbi:hypothetical protein GGR55DRAFT_651387 [Xylaria sp. FL0064]|nr:hypothetical protein GGR55DRAFT_651387 [Xylaria sp. FL0064]
MAVPPRMLEQLRLTPQQQGEASPEVKKWGQLVSPPSFFSFSKTSALEVGRPTQLPTNW